VVASLVNACQSRLPAQTVSRLVTPTAVSPVTPSPWPTQRPTATATPDPTATPEPSPTATAVPEETATVAQPVEEGVSMVALVFTDNRAEGVRRAVDLLAVNNVSGYRVLLKPNLNSADPPPGSTHLETMRSLVNVLEDMGARAITMGERSGMGNTRQVAEQTGMSALTSELGIETVLFDELAESDWVVRHSSDFHWSDGFAVPRLLLDSDCVVQTCNLKTHRYGGHFTLSLKNGVGFVARTTSAGGYNYMSELHDSPFQRHMIAEINTVYRPGLIVLDGVEAFVNGGPAQGSKVQANVVLASTDPVAIDAVGVAILRLLGTTPEVSQGRIFEQAQILRAVELGLGVESAGKIRIVTGDAHSRAYANQINQLLLAG